MISPQQLRAARALLGLSDTEFAARAGISADALHAAETDGTSYDQAVSDQIKKTLEQMGVALIADGEGGGGCGVRMKSPREAEDGIRPEDLNATNDD